MTKQCIMKLTVVTLVLLVLRTAFAVQVQDLVRLKGTETSTLLSMGLVVGLAGTGDSKLAPVMRSLAEVINRLIDQNIVASELANAKNVALVALEATIPASGVREGDRIDVHVSALGSAKSLQGGRLFLIPMVGPLPDSPVYAFASGQVLIEDVSVPTVGVIRKGAQVTVNVMAQYFDEAGRLTLVLNEEVATWPMATNLANVINDVLVPDGPNIAKAIDQRNVEIEVAAHERVDPANFISQILQSYIDPGLINTGARVLINEKTGTIVVGAEVQISPVIITHQGLTITTITPPPESSPQNRIVEDSAWTSLDPEKRAGPKLADLVEALKQLQVSAADRIAIVKEIHRAGKLHGQLITH